MRQCKAMTERGTRCTSAAGAGSRNLCPRHHELVAAGARVVNFETRKKFPTRGTRNHQNHSFGQELPAQRKPVREPRSAGEHPIICDAARCRQRALPGSDFCMRHQNLA